MNDLDKYLRCAKCIMNTTDPDIYFDGEGVCNHCLAHGKWLETAIFKQENAQELLEEKVRTIKDYGKKHEYDCLIGLSGGLDSSY